MSGHVLWRYVIPGWGKIIEPVDLFGREIEDNETLADKRDQLAELIENSRWYKEQPADGDLITVLHEFRAADDPAWIEDVLMHIYDLADEQRVWLDPFDIQTN
jgi:hypothetical protein